MYTPSLNQKLSRQPRRMSQRQARELERMQEAQERTEQRAPRYYSPATQARNYPH